MKARKIEGKLILNKKTLVNLDDTDQLLIIGGLPNTSIKHIYDCYTQCDATGPCIACPW